MKIAIKESDSNIERILDLGFVGEPTKINIKKILISIKNGKIPVIAPLGIDKNGNTYNINADTVAGAVAGALKASKLLLLTDVDGILDQNIEYCKYHRAHHSYFLFVHLHSLFLRWSLYKKPFRPGLHFPMLL